ncbi:Predicted transglutaminase-like cysteine proteinase [Roseateles sp. YR242]|uniref:transglutaminase-like cysteine peptidase n=1 Tax=Roseateles sp. YR242 TaxID=1855305 RepID=UPI0008AEFA46|nr:transglutaminase-like cysteine peptidase [Roseateles sp. YR242]SEK99048.1 Predicted transglutaminase-like cysteine proteinase [Roseateles sp. YR242]
MRPPHFSFLLHPLDRARRVLGVLACLAALGTTLWSEGARAWDRDKLEESAAARSPRTLVEMRAMLQMVQRAAAVPEERQRLTVINNFFNQRIAFRDDTEVWGVIDYWATPLELLDKGRGDCEDYAIAKYMSLLAAGVPQARLRMVYVRAQFQGRSQAHMVLAYYPQPDAEPLILDNINPEIRAASQRGDLTPVFSFNGEGLWTGVGATTAGNPLVRLSLWRDLLARAKEEGF